MPFNIDAMGKAVQIIGDSHLPYEHRDYLNFCQAVNKKYKCKIHLHAGDFEDQHAISFHDSDVDLFSAGKELELVIFKTEDWYKAYPKLITLDSNHGSLVIRKFKKHGIPIAHMKSLGEVYKTPGWSWYESILLKTILGNVYLTHGKSAAYLRLAKDIGCSAIQGHFHTKLEICWWPTEIGDRFNMFTGCGVDRKSLAMTYMRKNIPVPALGCAVIDELGIPHIEKMLLDNKGRWNGKL